jgi:phospholipid transport system transporter-binding protein
VTALRIERLDAGHARVEGRLGFAEAAAALARGSELYGAGGGDLSVDLAGLDGVDSATLAVLLAWVARARRAGVALHFAAVPDDLRALAHLCDAEPLLGIA